jgi:hypothetical protein
MFVERISVVRPNQAARPGTPVPLPVLDRGPLSRSGYCRGAVDLNGNR